ncbi:TIGR04053 family radical SAM/SPASM domain-containing protein [Halosimplex rubrum]|uniref:TIGR04053 family radical SAM/SPASM domain-containing protein n=1 Tax=Halosimplex rubrum TaxID=869889 RepID=A0A7D5P8J2_9EURY|nr:TIGR04053 family radical SAM/SPASM domain-containing protein [Halosimplex rubrum]QLH79998.1 TIGR04053 family radical SAM/SPASM domain-containing protein [Halosimplex rubrum]
MRPPVDTAERPLVLIWEVTQACELTCDHCRADAQPARHPDELSTAEGKELLDQAADFGDRQLVVLSGGDPMKRPDLVDLVDYGTDRGLTVSLTPSGTDELDAGSIGALADAGLKRMALSLDGATPERHDAFRGEAGSFEATMRAARQAQEAGIPLQINTTVCADTVEDLPAIRDAVADLGAVLWSVFFLVPVGCGRVLDPVPPERAERVMEWLAEVADEAPFGLKTTEAPHYRRVRRQAAAESAGSGSGEAGDAPTSDENRRASVLAGDGFAFVSHTGEVYPSGFLPRSAGTVPNDHVAEVYRESELFTALRDRDELRGKCGACPFRGVCGGSRSRAYAHTGDPLASDPLCGFVPPNYDGALPWDDAGEAVRADGRP